MGKPREVAMVGPVAVWGATLLSRVGQGAALRASVSTAHPASGSALSWACACAWQAGLGLSTHTLEEAGRWPRQGQRQETRSPQGAPGRACCTPPPRAWGSGLAEQGRPIYRLPGQTAGRGAPSRVRQGKAWGSCLELSPRAAAGDHSRGRRGQACPVCQPGASASRGRGRQHPPAPAPLARCRGSSSRKPLAGREPRVVRQEGGGGRGGGAGRALAARDKS